MDTHDEIRVVEVLEGDHRNLVNRMRSKSYWARQCAKSAVFCLEPNGNNTFPIPPELLEFVEEEKADLRVNADEGYIDDYAIVVCDKAGKRLSPYSMPTDSFEQQAMFSQDTLVTVRVKVGTSSVEITEYSLQMDTDHVQLISEPVWSGEIDDLPVKAGRFQSAAKAAVMKADLDAPMKKVWYVK